MKYKIFKEIRELDTFEEAMILGGLPRQPEFSEAHGDLFFHAPSGIAILAMPEDGDDVYDSDLGEPKLKLSDFDPTGIQTELNELTAAEPVYHSMSEYFAANPEPQHDDADALTDDEAEELTIEIVEAANQFLKEMGETTNAQP